MKILILEDNPERMKWFNKKFINHVIFHFDNAIKACEFLDKNYNLIDLFFLDHDLDGRSYVSSEEENTGFTTAKKINELGNDGKNIIIHSMNPIGAMNIKKLFDFAEWIPFCDIEDRINVL